MIGFDTDKRPYPAQLVLQDVLTLHGSQFKDATCIVASPPCQAYSYRAMPWKRAKALPPPDNTLFDACFRIQREACEAAGRYIPMVVENVCGAQKWVGKAKWHYGSYYLWGDVPALMPLTLSGQKVPGNNSERSWSERRIKRLRDAGSALIAKIPFPLAQHIARVFKHHKGVDDVREAHLSNRLTAQHAG